MNASDNRWINGQETEIKGHRLLTAAGTFKACLRFNDQPDE